MLREWRECLFWQVWPVNQRGLLDSFELMGGGKEAEEIERDTGVPDL
uniref:Uncharacterized protein n=1 Tax=Thermosporothrix sp. COM3 TaxID=2490863 RepID=A0A455SIQ3_9CHLR|nr:hypothetical protein KTC_19520 [Thermosporothrix sp. COM3]